MNAVQQIFGIGVILLQKYELGFLTQKVPLQTKHSFGNLFDVIIEIIFQNLTEFQLQEFQALSSIETVFQLTRLLIPKKLHTSHIEPQLLRIDHFLGVLEQNPFSDAILVIIHLRIRTRGPSVAPPLRRQPLHQQRLSQRVLSTPLVRRVIPRTLDLGRLGVRNCADGVGSLGIPLRFINFFIKIGGLRIFGRLRFKCFDDRVAITIEQLYEKYAFHLESGLNVREGFGRKPGQLSVGQNQAGQGPDMSFQATFDGVVQQFQVIARVLPHERFQPGPTRLALLGLASPFVPVFLSLLFPFFFEALDSFFKLLK